jgi:hypothetical protein
VAKTQLFEDLTAFLERDDTSINGVTADFAKEHGIDLEADDGNTGCWNCLDCERCVDCKYCKYCRGCLDCKGCAGCKYCKYCTNCWNCVDCTGCVDCVLCVLCLNCVGCTDCTGTGFDDDDDDDMQESTPPAENDPTSPNHYKTDGVECIDAIRAMLGKEGFEAYCRGNVVKYNWRYKEKNGLEDLKKAAVYQGWLNDSVGTTPK